MFKDNNRFKKTAISFFVLFFIVLGTFGPALPAKAQWSIVSSIPSTISDLLKKMWDEAEKVYKKSGETMLNNVLRQGLNRLAYDAADNVVSGLSGQKPAFLTKRFGDHLADIGDAAAGDFLDQLNHLEGINLCSPDLNIVANIGLGLKDQKRPPEPSCKASTMVKAWGDEVQKFQDMTSKDFTQRYISYFKPQSNDLGVTVSLFEGMSTSEQKAEEDEEKEMKLLGGYIDEITVGGQKKTTPKKAKEDLDEATRAMTNNLTDCDGDPWTCAAQVFLNRLAISGFQRAMEVAFTPDEQDPLDDFNPYDLTNPDSDPATVYHSNQAKVTKILEPKFNERADYDILAELVTCPDTDIPSPNNCVIDNKFSSAISEQKTVGEAMREGYLHKDWRFTGLNQKVPYNEAYNYRSILILKKYRIVPAGWEEAIYRANQQQAATLEDLVSCFSLDDDYNTFSQGFAPNQEWCKGLVDPRWVLKAPSNYCAKEGYGNVILNKEIMEGQKVEEGDDVPSDIILTRTDGYCADEQSCIKENSDGTCEAYGYCSEEKRTWNFNQDSCEPVYNTCQTFKNTNNGKTISYLENTLDYGDCTSDSAGCRLYSLGGSYNVDMDSVDWKAYNAIYLNSNTETCASTDEGCDKLIRIQAGYGHNFLKNGNFEESENNISLWCSSDTCLTEDTYSGTKSLDLSSINVNSNVSIEVGPQSYNIAGKTYTFSFYAKDCTEGDDFGFIDGKYSILDDSADWQYYRLSNTYPSGQYLGNEVDVEINSSTCKVDNIKLELGDKGTNYSDYGANNIVYQKMLPEYLWNDCYENPYSGNLDFSLQEDAPSICSEDFSRFCNADEAGCMVYTNAEDRDDKVVAQTSVQDYCQAECNNYDLYIGAEDYFNSTTGAKMIPDTANACSATDAGCTEFTNLDALNSGGEAKEYYKSLKQCIKPSENDCATFYVWQGQNQGGYQLESYTLKKASGVNEPAVVEDDGDTCNENIYNLPITDPSYNPDCYQFYNTEGEVSYHSYSKTVTCSDDCHPYRMSKKNVDTNINNDIDCNALGDESYWENNTDTCYVCKNGGTWSSAYEACVYQAIPGQGESCSQEANGCREYNGNAGNNIRIVETYDFADSLQGWRGKCGDAAELSTEALGRNDHSLWYGEGEGGEECNEGGGGGVGMLINTASAANDNERAEVELGSYKLNRGAAYNLKFMAKVNTATDLDVYFENDNELKSHFEIIGSNDVSSVTLNGDNNWHQYELSLKSLSHRLSLNEALVIESDNSFYLDNVILREIVDRYYLIEDSFETPNSCYYDTLGEYQGVDYNLGCSAYNTQSGATEYLRSFTSLCQESAVGCQLMANTYNTQDYKGKIYNDTNENGTCDSDETSCVNVSEDEYIFAVYSPDNSCSAEVKGCQRLGETVTYGQSNLFNDAYLKNDPDKYSTILCDEDTANCESYVSDTGENVYFKDPGNKLCEWREGDNNEWSWFKKDVNRCDANNNSVAGEIESACQSSSDCAIPKQLLDDAGINNTCSVDEDCRLNVCEDPGSGVEVCSVTGNSCSDDSSCYNNNSCENERCVYECVAPEEDFACPVDPFKTIGYGGAGNQVRQPTEGWAGICENTSSTCTEFIDPVSDHVVNELFNPRFNDVDNDGEPGDKWIIEGNYVYQNVNLIANRAYVFAANNVDASVMPTLECTNPLRYLNNNNELSDEINPVTLEPKTPAKVNRYKLVLSPINQTCKIVRGTNNYNSEDNFELIFKEAIIDYQLSKNLDTKTCNGKVDIENGCILFNQRDQNGSNVRALIYNTYDSYISDSKSPIGDDNYLNANTLVKVSPNRVCSQWLACQTKYIDENGDTICYDVADCDALDKDGECANFLTNPEEIHTFDTAKDKNSSGYSVLNKNFVSSMYESGVSPQSSSFNFEGDNANPWGGDGDSFIVDEPAPLDDNKQFTASYPAEGKAFLKSKATAEVTSPAISIEREQQYYINYLLNTNNLTFGRNAKISILEMDANDNTQELVFWEDRTNQWERKIYEFTSFNADKIKIQISSNDKNENKYIYIDDISIEPVLKIKDSGEPKDKYVSKSCRLYPKQDSLSCTSTNENVIASGWQGYCLQKDPYYPDVCLMWYPVDTISTFTNKDSGYKGKTPLYYCSQADGNFVLAERRMPVYLQNANASLATSFCYSNDDFGQKSYGCDSDGCKFDGGTVGNGGCSNNFPSSKHGVYVYFKDSSQETRFDAVYTKFYKSGDDDDYNRYYNDEVRSYYCSFSEDYVPIIIQEGQCYGNIDNKVKITAGCFPVPSDVNNFYDSINDEINIGQILYYDDTSSDKARIEATNQNTNALNCPDNEFEGLSPFLPLEGVGWYKYNDSFVYKENDRNPSDGPLSNDPIFKVYDYYNNNLKKLKEYGIRCSQFEQVVKNDGSNKAWAVRSNSSTNSTPFFFDPYNNILNNYIYNREDQPFGSAILSSGAFEEGDVYFKNKFFDTYYDAQKDSYAGIPYGCIDNENSGNCKNIGYCSNNPTYTCIIAKGDGAVEANEAQCGDGAQCIPYFVNTGEGATQYNCSESGANCWPQTQCGSEECVFDGELNKGVCSNTNIPCIVQCADGGGECISSGETTESIPEEGKKILRRIFLKSYTTKLFNADSNWEDGSPYDYSFTADKNNRTPICSDSQLDENGKRLEGEHCAIYPKIKNISLYKGDSEINKTDEGFVINESGRYDLKFNSIVDEEQLPLVDIQISWGDGDIVVITDQDHRPAPEFPHIISHNYVNTGDSEPIKIRINDNWGYNRCCLDDRNCSYYPPDGGECPTECPVCN
jgi:hypothetical protein